MNRRAASVVAVTAVAASVALAAPASAIDWRSVARAAAGPPKEVATDLFLPLSVEIDRKGTAFLSQNALGALTRVARDGTTSTIAQAPPEEELGAVSERNGTVYYYEGNQGLGTARLMSVPASGGSPVQVADLGAYEQAVNPDQVNTYEFEGLTQACADQFLPGGPIPPSYTGLIDTHPYATLATDDAVFVAEAGGNAILRVGHDGAVSTTAVLPPSAPIPVTSELAAAFGLPECAAGSAYRSEPVPTDVEIGPDGRLYVSTLPGAGSPVTGGRGSVYRIDPGTGEAVLVASGLSDATGLAVTKHGVILVTELTGGAGGTGQVSFIVPGVSAPVGSFALTSPAAIEVRNGYAYVTRDAVVVDEIGPQPIGRLTAVRLRGGAFLWG